MNINRVPTDLRTEEVREKIGEFCWWSGKIAD